MRKTLKTVVSLIVLLGVGLAPVNGVWASEIKKAKLTVHKITVHKSKVSSVTPKRKTASFSGAKKIAKATPRKRVSPVLTIRSRVFQETETGLLAVQSGAALVIDQSGEALYQKNAGLVTPIASINRS